MSEDLYYVFLEEAILGASFACLPVRIKGTVHARGVLLVFLLKKCSPCEVKVFLGHRLETSYQD
jgi:hypothetical protein